MAVTITTQFYQYDTPDWENLSKVVFTSPNIPSPASVGTRSHILPGQLPLGLWYEDTSFMYRIMTEQVEITSYNNGNAAGGPYNDFVISPYNSVVFEVTSGECYDCRLTAWDDSTHTSTASEMLVNDHAYIAAISFRSSGNIKSGGAATVDGLVHALDLKQPVKGNTNYYGDFNMIYAPPTTGYYGDFVVFKPTLSGIDASVPYGIHDFVMTLHYTYA